MSRRKHPTTSSVAQQARRRRVELPQLPRLTQLRLLKGSQPTVAEPTQAGSGMAVRASAPLGNSPLGSPVLRLAFSRDSLADLRRAVAGAARHARLTQARCQDLVLTADELATNSVIHGGGNGELRLWCTEEGVICEVRDGGHISDPLVGLRPPRPEQHDGRGLWVVGKLARQMEISSSPARTRVRVLLGR